MPKKLETSVTKNIMILKIKFIAILVPEFSDLIKIIFNVLSMYAFSINKFN